MEVCVGVTERTICACAKTVSLGTSARCVSGSVLIHELKQKRTSVLSCEMNHFVVTACLCPPQVEDPCILKPCGNRGQCWSDRRGNYNCICQTGHTGKDCEKGQLRVTPVTWACQLFLHTKKSFLKHFHCFQTCCLPLAFMWCVSRRMRWSCVGMSRSRPTARSLGSLSLMPPLAGATTKQTTWTGSSQSMWCRDWCLACCTTSPPSPSNATPTVLTIASLLLH